MVKSTPIRAHVSIYKLTLSQPKPRHYLPARTAVAILRPLPLLLFSPLRISPKDLPSLCFWVVNPILNPYLSFLNLNTHLLLSLVLLLLDPNKTVQLALEGLSTASVKSVSTLSCLSKSKASSHSLQSCCLVSKCCLTSSEISLHFSSRLFRQSQKKQVTTVLCVCFPTTYISAMS